MASLTPGVLSKLLRHAGTDFKVAGDHRSPLLQVLEILPSGADGDPLRSSGFFLKVSDSLHSTFVSVSGEDADLIFADKIQLGQLIHVSRLDSASPVPVLRGVRPLPRRRPCIGSPRDLVAGDLLDTGDERRSPEARASRRLSLGGGGGRKEAAESMRRSWQRSPGAAKRNVVPRSSPPLDLKRNEKSTPSDSPFVVSDKKTSPKSDSLKHQSLISSPLKSRSNQVSMRIMKPSREETKPSGEEITPCHLVKVQLSTKDWNQSILWDELSPSLHDLGKDALHHRNAAFFAAAQALQEASAAESVIRSLSEFTEICTSVKQDSPWVLVERFLNFHQSLQQAVDVTEAMLKMSNPRAKGNLLFLPEAPRIFNDKRTMATSWIQAALETDLSSFSTFNKKDKKGSQCEYQYVILETPSNQTKAERKNPSSEQNPKKQAGVPTSGTAKRTSLPRQVGIPAKKNNFERVEQSADPGLKETASLAKFLLSFSRGWFLKYLDGALDDGFGAREGEEDSEIAGFVRQLKRVNEWLDDMVGEKFEIDESVEKLRKKLYRFLLEHVDYTMVAGRKSTS
ncbi:hypothetical protein AAC387_Pa02g2918 [Persea americana]